ncbi:MAG: hypothetical protein HY544_00065 [Candidatus Diapherotrites archaeon]|uniref:Uncharacterized protein n=1 Tax=Candidatus Iainarchaeum sp. TaxID=3101447 RepID=A0A8T3YLW0_9ARCH|nr:hypothetical protein [Candidatus Diapherotrites archaeon]
MAEYDEAKQLVRERLAAGMKPAKIRKALAESGIDPHVLDDVLRDNAEKPKRRPKPAPVAGQLNAQPAEGLHAAPPLKLSALAPAFFIFFLGFIANIAVRAGIMVWVFAAAVSYAVTRRRGAMYFLAGAALNLLVVVLLAFSAVNAEHARAESLYSSCVSLNTAACGNEDTNYNYVCSANNLYRCFPSVLNGCWPDANAASSAPSCVKDKALELARPALCEHAGAERDTCYLEYAQQNRNPHFCTRISDPETKAGCIIARTLPS